MKMERQKEVSDVDEDAGKELKEFFDD